jgi:hypothetical protein
MSSSADEIELALTQLGAQTGAKESRSTRIWHDVVMAVGLVALSPILLFTLAFALIPAVVLVLPLVLLDVGPRLRLRRVNA